MFGLLLICQWNQLFDNFNEIFYFAILLENPVKVFRSKELKMFRWHFKSLFTFKPLNFALCEFFNNTAKFDLKRKG